MANEAVKIEQGIYNARRYAINDTVTVTKGALMMLEDPRTASGSVVGTNGGAFAGIATMDKVANDGSSVISCWTDGIFDLTCHAGAGINAGALVSVSGVNFIKTASEAEVAAGGCVGKALETATASEVIAVAVGRSI